MLVAADALLRRVASRWLARLPAADRAMLETRYRLLVRVAEAAIVFVGVVAALFTYEPTRGIASTVLASSAVLGLAFGFAARSVLANTVAGLMIAINQPVRLGDRVALAGAEGVVEDIGLNYTRLRTGDNRRILIPNEQLANAQVTNQTIVDPASLASVRVTVPAWSDPARVREILEEQAALAPGRAPERPDPAVAVEELSGAEAVFSVGVWTTDAAAAASAASWLRERCMARLAEEGVLGPQGAEVAR